MKKVIIMAGLLLAMAHATFALNNGNPNPPANGRIENNF